MIIAHLISGDAQMNKRQTDVENVYKLRTCWQWLVKCMVKFITYQQVTTKQTCAYALRW